ncbi:MAG: peptidylprolyl isomerase [Candidatus Kapaibacterium sp.]|jgi:peptidyl-prolyl cis-trans isomerase B (cyclophilin B)
MKRLLFACLLLTGAIVTGFTPQFRNMDAPYTQPYKGAELDKLTSHPNRLVVIETKLGVIKLQLFDKIAPKHVANITKLIHDKFYDGLTFHRVIEGFMIQGGDPNSNDDDLSNDGMGKPGQVTVPAEFSALNHKRGILSAARTNDPNSATSQFFICVGDATFLDGKYTIYGQVTEGMDVVDKIVKLPKIVGDNPGKAAIMTRVTITE